MNKIFVLYYKSMEQWNSAIISSWCSNKINCLYGCCCPACAIASAKTKFDNTNWIFNLCCFGLFTNQCIVRSYIRDGYNIKGTHMSDCFYSYCCSCCSATQMLNEVENRGVIDTSNSTINTGIKHKYESILENTPICFDNISSNIDCLCVCLNIKAETASVYSNFTGFPLWYSFLSNVNICQLNHMIRQKYNIQGEEFKRDIITPILFTYTTIETMRNVIKIKNNFNNSLIQNIEWYGVNQHKEQLITKPIVENTDESIFD